MRTTLARRCVLGSIILAGIVLRLLFVWSHAHEPLYGDQEGYWREASTLVKEGRLEESGRIRPPLYRLLLAAMHAVGGGSVPFVRQAQVLLAAGSMLACYLLAREFVGVAGGMAAVAVYAFHPDAVSSPALLLTEELFTPLSLLALWCSGRLLMRPGSRRLALLAGIAWASASLTRSVSAFYFVCILGGLVLSGRGIERRTRVTGAAIAALTFCLTITPWAIRNGRMTGAFVPIAEDGAFNIWWRGAQNVDPDLTQRDFKLGAWSSVDDPRERSRTAVREGLRGIASDPGRFLKGCISRSRKLWIDNAMPLFAVHQTLLQHPTTDGYTLALLRLERPYNLAVLILAAGGILLSLRSRAPLLLSGFVLYQSAAYAALASLSRYRLPAIPLLAILAVLFLRESWRVVFRRAESEAPRGVGPDLQGEENA